MYLTLICKCKIVIIQICDKILFIMYLITITNLQYWYLTLTKFLLSKICCRNIILIHNFTEGIFALKIIRNIWNTKFKKKHLIALFLHLNTLWVFFFSCKILFYFIFFLNILFYLFIYLFNILISNNTFNEVFQ